MAGQRELPEDVGVHVVIVNEDRGYRIYDEVEWDIWPDTYGELYRMGREEYGRCQGKVYVDGAGRPEAVGWAFEKLARYQDTGETYHQTTWVMPVRKVEEARPMLIESVRV